MNKPTTERGQVLVIIILASVVLFGVAALAVDGGRYYAERRRAQNAADAAALAAAFASTEKRDWAQAAMGQAQENGYNDPNAAKEDNLQMDVHVHNPPVSGLYQGKKEYYQVVIRNRVEFIFAQFVYAGTLEVQVEAVARAKQVGSPYPGMAFVATNHSACRAVNFSGGGETLIDGGNVFSNSGGTGNCASGLQNGSGSITVENGDIQVAGDWVTKGGAGSVSPRPAENVDQIEDPDLPVPDCYTNVPARNQNNYTTSKVLEPGRYTGIKITNGDWKMNPGMYCFTSTGFSFNGGSITGYGVFLAVLGGDVSINGSGETLLIRPDDLMDSATPPNQWGGMLIYMPFSSTGGIDLNGGSATKYTGTILAPGPRDSNKPKCTVSGNAGSISMSANIICNTLEVTGTANVEVHYVPKQTWQLPPTVDLSQ